METELIAAIARANLVAAVAVVAVLALRSGIRRWFGAQSVYALWILPPVAALAAMLPARRVVEVITRIPGEPHPSVAPSFQSFGAHPIEYAGALTAAPAQAQDIYWPQALLVVWFVGVLASICFLAWRQHRYIRALGPLDRSEIGGTAIFHAQSAHAIPALVGALRPRVIVPRDFNDRFSADERGLILAHERTHLERGDAQINALIAVFTCLCWFNPLVHIAAIAVRRDQELSCDATVVARLPHAKRAYARALLKVQTPGMAIPLGCAWPAAGRHSLHERISLLGAERPARGRRLIGAVSVGLLSATSGVAAWAAQPVTRETVFQVATHSPVPSASEVAPPAQPSLRRGASTVQDAAFASIAQHRFGPPQTFANTQVELSGIAARLRVVPENRTDISVEIEPGVNLPIPTARLERGHLVIDGGLGMTTNNCRTRFDGVGLAEVPGVGAVDVEAMPVIVVRTPRQLNLLVRGVVVSDIGASDGGRVRIDGCGDARVGNAAYALEVGLHGFGNVDVGAVRGTLTAQLFGVGNLSVARADGDAIANLIGSGDLTVGPVGGAMEARMQGSGELTVGAVGAGAALRLPGSGPVHFGAITGRTTIEASGSSVARIDAVRGDMHVALDGSTNLDVLSGLSDRLIVQIDGSDRMHFGGRAGFVRATLGNGAGNVTVAEADRVERRRAPDARGDLIIQHQR